MLLAHASVRRTGHDYGHEDGPEAVFFAERANTVGAADMWRSCDAENTTKRIPGSRLVSPPVSIYIYT